MGQIDTNSIETQKNPRTHIFLALYKNSAVKHVIKVRFQRHKVAHVCYHLIMSYEL